MSQTTTETLHDCPKCGRKNFTAKGLKGHVCKGALTVVPAQGLTRIEAEVPLHNLYHRNAMLSAAQAACWLVLAGAELLRQKKQTKHGQWLTWVEENCEFSEETARKYMGLAEGVKDKALKHAAKGAGSNSNPDWFLELLEKPTGSLSTDEQIALLKAVHHLTDGATVSELYEDFGIVRRLKSGGGNNHPQCPLCEGALRSHDQAVCPHCHQPTGYGPQSPEQQLAEVKSKVLDWAGELMTSPRFTDRSWRVLEKHDAVALAAHLREQAAAIEAWFAQPAQRRAEMSIEELLGSPK